MGYQDGSCCVHQLGEQGIDFEKCMDYLGEGMILP